MAITIETHKYQLTDETPAATMNVRLNFLEQNEATDGRSGGAKAGGGGIAADDGGCGLGLCQQQCVAHDAAGRDYQCGLQLFERARGPGGATTTRAGETGGADSKIGDS